MSEKVEKSPIELEMDAIKAELEPLSKEELIEELAFYKFIIPKLGPWVKWAIDSFYKPIACRWRMGREAVGLLVGVIFHPEVLVLLSHEEIKKYEIKKIIHEQHLVYAPTKELSWYDVILGKTGEEEIQI